MASTITEEQYNDAKTALASGVKTISVDGRTVARDLELLRKQVAEYEAANDPTNARSAVNSFNLSGF